MGKEKRHIELEELLAKYLAGEASDDQIKEIDQWKSASDANMNAFEDYSKIWNKISDIQRTEPIDVDAEWKHFRTKLQTKKSSNSKTFTLKRLLQAASVLVFLQLGYFGYKMMMFTTFESSAYEMRGDIVLPDGSSVSLNANSKIIVPKDFGPNSRELELEGEGYFDVSKNKDVPFVVHARGASIKVIGTEFNIRKTPNDIKVSVYEGMVEMFASSKPSERVKLTTGESGTYYNGNSDIKKGAFHNANDIAWKTKVLDVNGLTLQETCDLLENVYHKSFRIDDAIKECVLYTKFVNEPFPLIVKVLEETFSLEREVRDDVIVFSGDKCND